MGRSGQHGSASAQRKGSQRAQTPLAGAAAMPAQHAGPLQDGVLRAPAVDEHRYGLIVAGLQQRGEIVLCEQVAVPVRDGRIAGQLLVCAHAPQGPPGQWVEPLQHQQCRCQQVPGVVASACMNALMVQDQPLLFGTEAPFEVLRQHQPWAPESEHGRTAAGRCTPVVPFKAQLRREAALTLRHQQGERQHAGQPEQQQGGRDCRGGGSRRHWFRRGGDRRCCCYNIGLDWQGLALLRQFGKQRAQQHHRHQQPGQVGGRRAQSRQQQRAQQGQQQRRQAQEQGQVPQQLQPLESLGINHSHTP